MHRLGRDSQPTCMYSMSKLDRFPPTGSAALIPFAGLVASLRRKYRNRSFHLHYIAALFRQRPQREAPVRFHEIRNSLMTTSITCEQFFGDVIRQRKTQRHCVASDVDDLVCEVVMHLVLHGVYSEQALSRNRTEIIDLGVVWVVPKDVETFSVPLLGNIGRRERCRVQVDPNLTNNQRSETRVPGLVAHTVGSDQLSQIVGSFQRGPGCERYLRRPNFVLENRNSARGKGKYNGAVHD